MLYLGKIMEVGPAVELFSASAAPLYAHSSISAAPVPDPRVERTRRHVRDEGRAAERAEPAERLPLPHALPDRRRALCPGGAALLKPRRPARRLPLPRTAELSRRRARARPRAGGSTEQDLHEARHDAQRHAEPPSEVEVRTYRRSSAAPCTDHGAHLVDDERNAQQRGHVARAEQAAAT